MIIQNSIFHVNFTIMQYNLLLLQLLLSTLNKFHWPHWDMHPASCLEMASDKFQPLGALLFQHFFQPLSCSYVHCVRCSSLPQSKLSKGTQCSTALDQIVRNIIKALSVPFYRSPKDTATLSPPSGYVPVCFRVLLFVGNLTLQSNQ